MGVTEFTISLYKEMEVRLSEVRFEENDVVQSSRQSSEIILTYLSKLKSFVSDTKFQSIDEEINFFKNNFLIFSYEKIFIIGMADNFLYC